MNYYYPYYVNPVSIGRPSLFYSLFNRGGFSLNTLLNGAQRALGLVNQALPIIKEAAPMMRNARTMFKVMNEFKKIDSPINTNTQTISEEKPLYSDNGSGPTFFA